MRMIGLLSAALVALVGSFAAPPAAMSADLVAVAITEPGICGHSGVLSRISSRFRYQVAHVPNLPDVAIVDFQQIRENGYSPRGERWPIERRYCQAVATLSDGYRRDVWYLIERPMGFVGFGSNVEFCVNGFDRWNVYGGRCRVLR